MLKKHHIYMITTAAFLMFDVSSAESVNCSAKNPGEIVGVWRLVEASTTSVDGTVRYPYGQPAAGIFIYTPGGHLSLHLNKNPPQAKFAQRPSDSELGAVAREYIGYYGTWSMTDHGVVHHIAGAMLPNRIGQDVVRPFKICGDVLELNIESKDGRRFYRRLERIESFVEQT